ncbi:MAG: UDP-N-acetylmuramoyl-L-alanine--D-glutamate ligase [Spirochaetes bacterium]|nr:UDP-N-acetylmuramoyl-L-alanine--D-glutamate ligase [Spirochaetota bacterium]
MNKGLKDYINNQKGKKVLIHGLGLNGGGSGSALFFLKNGFNVTITDLKKNNDLLKSIEMLKSFGNKIKFVLGEHREIDFKESNLIVKSPAIRPDNKFIKLAENNGAYITSDIEIFSNICPCPIYALTGSKGKSTTVTAIYEIFKKQSSNAYLGGNITISPLTFYEKLNEKSLVILELSSWQLRDLKNKKFRFKGAAIINLLKDHQNYYSSMKDYLSEKLIITDNQTDDDFIIIPFKDDYIKKVLIKSKAKIFTFDISNKSSDIFYKDKSAYLKNNNIIKLFDENDLNVIGEHMKINMLLAASFCYLAGINIKNIKKGIKQFKGAPYRMELVRTWKGIKFINDTTATIPEAVFYSIKSYKTPIIWIGGGNDKNLDFSIIKKIADIPKKIYLLKGEGTEKMKKYITRDDITESISLEEILTDAVKSAEKGDIILLSPGCTSFGLFQNEFHRGEVFNKFVKSL